MGVSAANLLREVNERIDSLLAGFLLDGVRVEYMCECDDPSCTDRIALTRAEFAEIRALHDCFVVAPDHGGGLPVRRTERYSVVAGHLVG